MVNRPYANYREIGMYGLDEVDYALRDEKRKFIKLIDECYKVLLEDDIECKHAHLMERLNEIRKEYNLCG
jgi:predicted ATPase